MIGGEIEAIRGADKHRPLRIGGREDRVDCLICQDAAGRAAGCPAISADP